MIAKGNYTTVEFDGKEIIISRSALGVKSLERIPVSEVMSIGWVEPSLWATGQFRVHIKGDSGVIGPSHPNCVLFKPKSVEEFRALKSEVEVLISRPSATTQVIETTTKSSKIEELTKLKELVDSGAISKDEFEMLKRELLA